MTEMLRPEQPEAIHESIHEHLELSHYIDVYRLSAERVRRIIIITMILSGVVLVAQWNATDFSWLARRRAGLEELYRSTEKMPGNVASERIKNKTNGRFQTRIDLKNYLDDFLKKRVEKVIFVEIPGLPVTFDINDLGNFSGVAYVITLTILLLSLARAHENLYLSLFKVRRLHDHGKNKSDGESTANYLYHSLAMSQVFNSPPTLAQWAPSKIQKIVLYLIFLVPAIVEGLMVYSNLMTLPVVSALGSTGAIMIPQYVLSLTTLVLGIVAIIYSRSCDRQWRNAFFYVNPSLRSVKSRPWRVWVGLSKARSLQDRNDRRMWNQAVTHLVVQDKAVLRPPVEVEQELPLKEGELISYEDLQEMRGKLETEAAAQTGLGDTIISKSNREITRSVLRNGRWQVAAKFFTQRPFRNSVPSLLGIEHINSIRQIAKSLLAFQIEGRETELERLIHPSAVLVGLAHSGRFKPGKNTLKDYWDLGPDIRIESLELGEVSIEPSGTTAVVTCPLTVRYTSEGVLYEERGRDISGLVYQGGTWLVIWRTLHLDKAEST